MWVLPVGMLITACDLGKYLIDFVKSTGNRLYITGVRGPISLGSRELRRNGFFAKYKANLKI